MRRPPVRAGGFTLLEVLVVTGLFALLAVAGHAALGAVLDAQRRVDAQLEGLAHLQTAFMLLERDLGQLVPRAVGDGRGGSRAAIAGAADGATLLLELTRDGWSNPAGAPRSSLERVVYRLDEGRLRRAAAPVTDAAMVQDAPGRLLLERVDGAQLRFLDRRRRWHVRWPLQDGAQRSGLLAVEVVLEVQGFGRLRRLFPVPPGAGA